MSFPHDRRANDAPGNAFPSVMSDRDAIWRFAEHVAGTDYEDLPESAAIATRTFLLDTLGVGAAGSAGPWTRCLIETQRLSCPGDQARVWSHGARLSAAIGRLAGFDAATLVNAFGAVLGQLSGTMQAHVEGSPMLGMQVGFGARNAIVACDMAARGLAAPQAVLEGPFGFFRLFEGEHILEVVLGELGRTWRATEVSHKPYPCGRATHAVVDACLGFRERLGLDRAGGDAVEQVTARVPPLVHRLVGRTVTEDMDVNYARLCCRYVAASALLRGWVVPEDFRPVALRDPDILELSRRVRLRVRSVPSVPAAVDLASALPRPPASLLACPKERAEATQIADAPEPLASTQPLPFTASDPSKMSFDTYRRTSLVVWLGTAAKPGALQRLCRVGSVRRHTGTPATNTAWEPITGRAGPMKTCETTPPMAPASSPCVIAYMESRFRSGIPAVRMVK